MFKQSSCSIKLKLFEQSYHLKQFEHCMTQKTNNKQQIGPLLFLMSFMQYSIT